MSLISTKVNRDNYSNLIYSNLWTLINIFLISIRWWPSFTVSPSIKPSAKSHHSSIIKNKLINLQNETSWYTPMFFVCLFRGPLTLMRGLYYEHLSLMKKDCWGTQLYFWPAACAVLPAMDLKTDSGSDSCCVCVVVLILLLTKTLSSIKTAKLSSTGAVTDTVCLFSLQSLYLPAYNIQ